MFTESEQCKKAIVAKMMNGFGKLCVSYLLIVFKKWNTSCKKHDQVVSQKEVKR